MSNPLPFKILGINHLGIAAKDHSTAKSFFQDTLQLPHLGDELVEDQNTMTVMFMSQSENGDDQTTRLELLDHGGIREDSPIKSYKEKKGGGIHHIALNVDDIDAALKYLDEKGIQLIDREPRKGAHDTTIAFLHPRATGGILVELVQGK